MAAALPRDRAEVRRQAMLGIGLLLLFLGLLLVLLELPNGPANAPNPVLVLGVILLLVWVSGILMGRSSGRRAPQGPG